jgi:hypothetical protein
MVNWKEWKGVGVQSVDMCASTIFTHRVKKLPIKAIHLLPRMYGQFQLWAERAMGKKLEEDQQLEFDGVYIECGESTQKTPLLIELWEN